MSGGPPSSPSAPSDPSPHPPLPPSREGNPRGAIRLPVGTHGHFVVRGPLDAHYEGESLPGQLETAWRIGPVHAVERRLAGDLVLHGNAVRLPGGQTILIVGGKGWGKSSLTAALLARGALPVADDVLAIYWDGTHEGAKGGQHPPQDSPPHSPQHPMLRPGHPWLKMWPDTARLAGYDPEALDRILPDFDKRLIAKEMVPEPVPVGEIVILDRGGAAGATTMGPTEAVVHLSAHAHHTPREHGLFGQWDLDACARLAREVPVRRLGIPEGLENVGEAADALSGS